MVNAHHLPPHGGEAKNKENYTSGPDKNGQLPTRLVEIIAGKVIDNGRHKGTGCPDYIAVDGQFVNMAISYHAQEYAEVPEGTDEEKAAEKVVIKLPAPREDKSQNGAVQEKANERCYGGSQNSARLHKPSSIRHETGAIIPQPSPPV